MAKSKEDKLWDIFSKYIRLRDSDVNGVITCISCGKRVYYKKADAGHFIVRQHNATRYDEDNVYGQCIYCNRLLSGNTHQMMLGIVHRRGEALVEDLKLRRFTGR